VANESAILESIHEGDQVFCGLHTDDLVVVRAK
jgi:spermidine/putrescine transport system ATP-binding protein